MKERCQDIEMTGEHTRLACCVPRPRGAPERSSKVTAAGFSERLVPIREGAVRNTRGRVCSSDCGSGRNAGETHAI